MSASAWVAHLRNQEGYGGTYQCFDCDVRWAKMDGPRCWICGTDVVQRAIEVFRSQHPEVKP